MRLVFGTLHLPDSAAAPRLLDRYMDAGGGALDVANVYQDGAAARTVGRWLARRSAQAPVLYAKGCHPPNCRPDLVAAEVDEACALLGVDRIDVFILHRDDLSYPVSAWAEALLAEVDAGRIGDFGVSNWTIERARELRSHLDAIGSDRLSAFSNHFSLARMISPPWPGCLALSHGGPARPRRPRRLGPRLVEPRDRLLRGPRHAALGRPREPRAPRARRPGRRAARDDRAGHRARVRAASARARPAGGRHALGGAPGRGARRRGRRLAADELAWLEHGDDA